MENGSLSAMNSTYAVDCNGNTTFDCNYDGTLYDHYTSLILLTIGLPHSFKTFLIVLYTGYNSD